MAKKVIDIDHPKVRAFVEANTEVFRLAMNGMVEAAQDPEADVEQNIALLVRATVAYASGICKTFHISPEAFAELMHFFDDVKIAAPDHHRIRIPKGEIN